MPTEPPDAVPGWVRVAVQVLFALVLLLYGSLFAGFTLESRAAAVLALVALACTLLIHLVLGAFEYRRVMGRDWPTVPPVADDDDWDAA